MRFAGVVGAAVAAAGLMMSDAANAALVDLAQFIGPDVDVTLNETLDLGESAMIFGGNVPGAITHDLTFTTTGPSLIATATSNLLPAGSGSTYNIADFQYQLFASDGTTALTGLVAAGADLLFGGGPGTYILRLTGLASGTDGGNYSGNLAVTPVPGALLLLGPALAGLGYVGYRRRKS